MITDRNHLVTTWINPIYNFQSSMKTSQYIIISSKASISALSLAFLILFISFFEGCLYCFVHVVVCSPLSNMDTSTHKTSIILITDNILVPPSLPFLTSILRFLMSNKTDLKLTQGKKSALPAYPERRPIYFLLSQSNQDPPAATWPNQVRLY